MYKPLPSLLSVTRIHTTQLLSPKYPVFFSMQYTHFSHQMTARPPVDSPRHQHIVSFARIVVCVIDLTSVHLFFSIADTTCTMMRRTCDPLTPPTPALLPCAHLLPAQRPSRAGPTMSQPSISTLRPTRARLTNRKSSCSRRNWRSINAFWSIRPPARGGWEASPPVYHNLLRMLAPGTTASL